MRNLKLAVLGWLGSWLVRGWIGSLRYQFVFEDEKHNPLADSCEGNHVIAIWHENILVAAYHLARRRQYTLISKSQDGEYIARIVNKMGLNTIRGSSSRGAVQAVRKLVAAAKSGNAMHIGVTTDGPRGPRRELKPGVIFLASKSGMSVLPVGMAYSRPWRAKSWDKFALPKPFSRTVVCGGEPVVVPEQLNQGELESYRQLVQTRLDAAQQRAEDILAGRPVEESHHPRKAAA